MLEDVLRQCFAFALPKNICDSQADLLTSEECKKHVFFSMIFFCLWNRNGEVLWDDNITIKRPVNGISPIKWFNVIGTCAVKDFEEDELIEM